MDLMIGDGLSPLVPGNVNSSACHQVFIKAIVPPTFGEDSKNHRSVRVIAIPTPGLFIKR